MNTLRDLGCAGSTAHPDEDADEDEEHDQHNSGNHAADAGVGHGFFGRAGCHGCDAVWVGAWGRDTCPKVNSVLADRGQANVKI